MQAESSPFIFFLFSGVGNCVMFFLALYNLVAFIGVMRVDDNEDGASALSKGAWGVGCLAAIFYPCAPVFSIVAFVLAKVEIGRVYRDESPLASATPARMGSVNAGIAFVAWVLLMFGMVISFVM